MIITCPACKTQYDVDVRRFEPDGRSVRCAECNESWFVPAPEPVEALRSLDLPKNNDASNAKPTFGKAAEKRAEEPAIQSDQQGQEAAVDTEKSADVGTARFRFGDDSTIVSEPVVQQASVSIEADDEPEEDPLFAPPPRSAAASPQKRSKDETSTAARDDIADDHPVSDEDATHRSDKAAARAEENPDGEGAWVYDAEEDRLVFRRHNPSPANAPEEAASPASEVSDGDRFGAQAQSSANRVVDADFEDLGRADDIDLAQERQRDRQGPRLRDERRRSTALARIEDLDPIAERVFNDEFFAALRVQPRELERALRKARRRAEARDKNRMTPMKALGWSAWAGVVAATLFVSLSYKDKIISLFPSAATAYEAVGLETIATGLTIADVTHRVAMSTQGPVIEITGRLKNDTPGVLTAPLLQAEALDADGGLLSRWTFAAKAEEVPSGAVVDFVTRAPAPDGVSEVALTFAPAEGITVSIAQ